MLKEKLVLLTFGSCALISLFAMTMSMAKEDTEPETKVINAETVASSEQIYVLREYNGKVASFYKGEETPIDVFNVSVDSFGEYDKQALYRGIIAYGEEELNKLIEDYTS